MGSEAKLFDGSCVDAVREQFERQRYVGLKSLITDGLASMLCAHLTARVRANKVSRSSTEGLESTSEAGADPLMENVLRGLTPRIEELTGLELYPTYSFCRLYRGGDRLTKHLDRKSCEVSVSINLGQVGENPWPLWISGPTGSHAATLAPGDALLYRGIECEHWRDPFEGKELAQLFLHYVDKSGPYVGWKFDRREALNTT